MEIKKEKSGSTMTVTVSGRLDTLTSPKLEEELKLSGVEKLIFDFEKLDYISSAGLRVMLGAQKTMMAQGEMELLHVSPVVREVFDMTGFSSFFTIFHSIRARIHFNPPAVLPAHPPINISKNNTNQAKRGQAWILSPYEPVVVAKETTWKKA